MNENEQILKQSYQQILSLFDNQANNESIQFTKGVFENLNNVYFR